MRVAVDIDLARLAAHLSSEEQRPVSTDECRRWLLDAGFERHGDRWVVEERDLGQLDPSEVRSIEPSAQHGAPQDGRPSSRPARPRALGRSHRRWVGSRRRAS